MTDIISAFTKIQVEGARYGSAGSESLIQAVGGSINGIIDHYNNLAANNAFAKLTFGSFAASAGSDWNASTGSGEMILAFASAGLNTASFSAGSGYASSDGKFFIATQSSTWSANGGNINSTVHYIRLNNTNIVA